MTGGRLRLASALTVLAAAVACDVPPPEAPPSVAALPGTESLAAPAEEVEPAMARDVAAEVEAPREAPAPRREAPPAFEAFAIDASKPLRISWPFDVGPGRGRNRDRPLGRTCLRGRQGANEIQRPGEGKALYGFRVPSAGRYVSFMRVRWLDDGVGSVDCNNSFFACVDDGAPAVIGNKNESTRWHWESGPGVQLDAGVHFFRIELREDGVFCDRIVIMRTGAAVERSRFEALPIVEQAGFAGARPPHDPGRPIRDVEIAALRTRSVVVGEGHANAVTVIASYQGSGRGFGGRVVAECDTARGVSLVPSDAEGGARIACSPEKPYKVSRFTFAFPPGAPMRVHYVKLGVVTDEGECIFREVLPFLKPPEWAFLGPFRDATHGYAGASLGGGGPGQAMARALSRRASREALAREAARVLPEARRVSPFQGQPAAWKVVADGSCYDELGAVDMFKVYGRTQNAFAYAVTWVRAETWLHHRSFTFSADDTACLWMGGRPVAVVPAPLPREANRLWSSARLEPDANPVVVKIAQGGRYWGFRLDVVDWHWQGRRGDVIYGVPAGEWPK